MVEKGITVAGKSLREHLEATNHAEALDYVRQLVTKTRRRITEQNIRDIHQIILSGIDDVNAGRYRTIPVRIAGSPVTLPNYAKVPRLMADFLSWLTGTTAQNVLRIAAEAHYRLVSIHPFVDGNGRTARLLMNLLLMQAGYPPAIIRPGDRQAYISSLEKGQLSGDVDTSDFYQVIYGAIDRSLSLDAYLAAIEGEPVVAPPASVPPPHRLLSRQQLSDLTGFRPSTIMYYTDIGLLPYHQAGPGLARRYDEQTAPSRLRSISDLQADGLDLEQIQRRFAAGQPEKAA